MTALVSIHFDGPIAVDHKVPVRTMARTYEHLQRAIDRAFLIEKFGDVYKHQRLTNEQYADTAFFAEYPREGGIILDAVKEGAEKIVERLADSIRPIYERALNQGLIENRKIGDQFREREAYVVRMQTKTRQYDELLASPPPGWRDSYSNRSVVKEIDQVVGQVTPRSLEGSTVELTFVGERPHLPFRFDASTAKRFHQLSSQKELAAPVIVNGIIRSVDRGNQNTKPSAKVFNLATGREFTLQCLREIDADTLIPHFNGEPVALYACPFVESLGFDVMAGDLVFISVVR